MKYTQRNRKEITLPSGGKIIIAKLNGFSDPFMEMRKGDDETSNGLRLAKFCLTNPSNGPLVFEGEGLRIVDKTPAGPGEISVSDLDQADADLIFKEVIAFSGLNSAGAEARKTFLEGQEATGKPS